MKFSDLTSNQRAILAALAASNKLGTDALGRACNPKLSPPLAANVLCSMREHGLLYSHAKLPNAPYCDWVISSVGVAVFTGRPDGDVRVTGAPVNGTKPTDDCTEFLIGSEAPGSSFKLGGTQEEALTEAQRHATANPGRTYKVMRLVAVAHMPVPQAVVTLL